MVSTRSTRHRRRARSTRTPLQMTKAQSTSTRSADASSRPSSAARAGSCGPHTNRAFWARGVLGRGARRGAPAPRPPAPARPAGASPPRRRRVDPVALDVDRRFAVLLQVSGDRGDERVAERDLALRMVDPPGRPQDTPEELGDVAGEIPIGLVGRQLASVLAPFHPGEGLCHPVGQEAFVQARREGLTGAVVTRHQTAR